MYKNATHIPNKWQTHQNMTKTICCTNKCKKHWTNVKKQTIVKHTQKCNKHSKQITKKHQQMSNNNISYKQMQKAYKTCQNNLQTIVKHVQQITNIPHT